MFDICLNSKSIILEGELIQPAQIIINDFSECMHIPISYWNIEHYKDSWKKSIHEGMISKTHATLITSMHDPKYLNFISTWIFYFNLKQVFVQNSIIFVDECKDFNIDEINKFVKPREIYDEDGMKISEWSIDISDVLEFYQKL